jgi:hypothetical protein
MPRESSDDRWARQDIRRAEVLMSLGRGLSDAESSALLRLRAAVGRVSLHEAALAVLAPIGSDEPADARFVAAPRHRPKRHLFAVPSESVPPEGVASEGDATDSDASGWDAADSGSTGRIESAR